MLCFCGNWGSTINTALQGMHPQDCQAVDIRLCLTQHYRDKPASLRPWHSCHRLPRHASVMLCAGGEWGSIMSSHWGGWLPQECRADYSDLCLAHHYSNTPASLRPLQKCHKVPRQALSMLCAGGDWGSAISTALGGMYPQNCRAIHINMCFARPSYTNPWHLAQIVNAKLPIANWFPVAISYKVGVNGAGVSRTPSSAAPLRKRKPRLGPILVG